MLFFICSYMCNSFAAAPHMQSSEYLKEFDRNPHSVAAALSITHYHPEDETLLTQKLLKKYTSAITAKHITPTTLIPGDKHALALALAFNDQSTLLASGGILWTATPSALSPGYIQIWNLHTHDMQVFKKLSSRVTALCFNPASNQLAVGDNCGDVHVLDMGGKRTHRYEQHDGRRGNFIRDICYSSDGTRLISASQGDKGCICAWNLSNGQCVARTSLPPLRYLKFLPEGLYYNHPTLTPVNESRGYYLQQTQDLHDSFEVKSIHDDKTYMSLCRDALACKFNEDESSLAVSFKDGSIQLYTCPTYEESVASIKSPLAALYILKKLQDKDCGWVSSAYNRISEYLYPQPQEAKSFFTELHETLPDTFKEIVGDPSI